MALASRTSNTRRVNSEIDPIRTNESWLQRLWRENVSNAAQFSRIKILVANLAFFVGSGIIVTLVGKRIEENTLDATFKLE